MLTRYIKRQLILFSIITVIALVVLGWYYLRIPSLVGIGQYTLKADLPASGGLYPTSNVTYRGITIGKVTDVEPTEHGAQATMSIDSQYKIPVNVSANVHSVSAVGEQYLDHHQGHGAQSDRAGAGHRQPWAGGAAQGEDRSVARRDGASGRRVGSGAATAGRLHPGDRRRLQNQHP
jgi:ABC-type transporter Mla subunit MlaD